MARRSRQIQVSMMHELAAVFDHTDNVSAFVRECTNAYLEDYHAARLVVHGKFTPEQRLRLVSDLQHYTFGFAPALLDIHSYLMVDKADYWGDSYRLFAGPSAFEGQVSAAIKSYVRAFWGQYRPARDIS